MKKFKFSTLLLVPVLAILAACGGGGGGSSSTGTPTLKSITIGSADNATTIAIGAAAKQMTATGQYSDGSSKVLAASGGLVWGPSNSTVLQISTAGNLTGKLVGTDTLTATQDGVTGKLAITVTAPWSGQVGGGIAAGGNQTIARKADGNLYSWGENIKGQLGDSTTINRNAPVLVSGGGTSWKQVAVGDQFAVAIRSDGTLWAWGYNQDGQLGDGTQINRTAPVQVGKDKDWNLVAAGKAHALAIKTSGLLYAWGRNDRGQLGDGTTINRTAPLKIGTAVWLAISAGETHTMGIQTGNDLYGWGGNTYGQVGNLLKVDVPAPVKIGTATLKVTSVSVGAFHSTAITTSGTLYAWGQNTYGQLGNNGSVDLTSPVQIGTDNNWSQIAAGAQHTIGVRNDGTLWSWGANTEGQLGTGGTDVTTPQQVGIANNWKFVAAGRAHSFALKADETLWGWGRNQEGQLGNGQTAAYAPIPVNVPN